MLFPLKTVRKFLPKQLSWSLNSAKSKDTNDKVHMKTLSEQYVSDQ